MPTLPKIIRCDSVTKVEAGADAPVMVTGSHGGLYAAVLAARSGVRAAIFNDAGVGKDKAGVRGLAALDECAMAAAAVDYRTARIGDAEDAWARGVISHVNETAAELGCQVGEACADCAEHMRSAKPPRAQPSALAESSKLISSNAGEPEVWALDSASLVGARHVGAVVLLGSHGGLLGGRPETAIKADVLAAVYNDAGIGIEEAGISRLPALDARHIAGATVSAESACIGNGLSTYADGILSRVNETARALGARPGQTATAFVQAVIACHKG